MSHVKVLRRSKRIGFDFHSHSLVFCSLPDHPRIGHCDHRNRCLLRRQVSILIPTVCARNP